MLSPGQHPDRQPRVVERGGRDRGAFDGDVGAHAEDAAAVGLGHDGGVHPRVVSGGDRIPGAVEVTVAVFAHRQGDSAHRLDGRSGAAGDDVDVSATGDEQR